MAAKFGPGEAETMLIGAKSFLIPNFSPKLLKKNPRLEILIQGNDLFRLTENPDHHRIKGDGVKGHRGENKSKKAQSQLIDTDR